MTLFDPLGPTASGFATPVRSKRLRLTVAYDGRRFHGFAAQPGQRTVEGSLSKAISSVVRHEVKLTCAGRTDAGVHAWGQVVHFDVAMQVDPKALARAVSSLLHPEVVVKDAEQVAPDFDARRSAISRRYRYAILPCRSFNPFLVGLVWQLRTRLNLRAMQAASDVFLGEHDFSAFCRRPPKVRGGAIERRVPSAGQIWL
ncbi:MAG: tRNA pseudouridine(38-40) synthase TruA, partial [Actinobacteria bacterium]|nr:tRNA pseudouridine(38-40) synthase TruA [Actinomycetota bacterium]